MYSFFKGRIINYNTFIVHSVLGILADNLRKLYIKYQEPSPNRISLIVLTRSAVTVGKKGRTMYIWWEKKWSTYFHGYPPIKFQNPGLNSLYSKYIVSHTYILINKGIFNIFDVGAHVINMWHLWKLYKDIEWNRTQFLSLLLFCTNFKGPV